MLKGRFGHIFPLKVLASRADDPLVPNRGRSEMTTIRANCPECGDVQLKVTDLTVRLCSNDDQGSYMFDCPSCSVVVTKDASRRIIDLLTSSGVELQVWSLPAELSEPHFRGPQLSTDDLLTFHELLETNHWFGDLIEMVRSAPSQ